MPATTYADRLVTIGDGTLTIRHCHFPSASSSRVPLDSIRSAREIGLGIWGGRYRLWGAMNPTYWFNLDTGRNQKRVGFVFDVGKRIRPVVTPDDPAPFRDALTANGVPVENEELPVSSPTA